MRNYRDLTPHEVERLKDEYPITANRHLAIRYDVSIDGIRTLAKKQGWKKDHNALLAGKRELHTLTAEEEAWIIKHFRNTPNAAIMQRIDIGESTLHRIARKHGLKKTSQYMNRARRLNAEVGTRRCRELGIMKRTQSVPVLCGRALKRDLAKSGQATSPDSSHGSNQE